MFGDSGIHKQREIGMTDSFFANSFQLLCHSTPNKMMVRLVPNSFGNTGISTYLCFEIPVLNIGNCSNRNDISIVRSLSFRFLFFRIPESHNPLGLEIPVFTNSVKPE